MDPAKEEQKRRHEMMVTMTRRSEAEMYWNPNGPSADQLAINAAQFRMYWNDVWARSGVSFEDTTRIPAMRLTDSPSPDDYGHTKSSLQIFSIKVVKLTGGLKWPLDVFGIVAMRDVLDLDRNRNIIFARPRSNCQTITEEDPYLELTGPTRGVAVSGDPSYLEVVLKVKGGTELHDRDLSFLGVMYRETSPQTRCCTSKRSTLELTFRRISCCVEATISVRVIGGSSWPDDFQGAFTASTASISDMQVLMLLRFRDGKLPVAKDGTIKLSRRVVSVGLRDGELNFSVMAQCESEKHVAGNHRLVFTPKKAGRSNGMLNVGSSKMQVTVAWSLFSYSNF